MKKEDTLRIAKGKGVRHPRNIDGNITMTTDLLVTFKDDAGAPYMKAFSVKSKRSDVFGSIDKPHVLRTVEKQRIEMAYWRLHGVPFINIFKEELPPVLVSNIELVVQRYRLPPRFSNSDVLRFLIARKQIPVDMDTSYIQDNMSRLLYEYHDQIEDFMNRIPKRENALHRRLATHGLDTTIDRTAGG